MSRAKLSQARNVVRLRDVRFDAAVEAFEAALSDYRAAEAAVQAAEATCANATDTLAAARRSLCGDPQCAEQRLALIGCAETDLATAEDAREAARRRFVETEHALEQARTAMLTARARRDAMANRAGTIATGIARAEEENAAIETEETMAAAKTGERA